MLLISSETGLLGDLAAFNPMDTCTPARVPPAQHNTLCVQRTVDPRVMHPNHMNTIRLLYSKAECK